jgi:hypothetical protein
VPGSGMTAIQTSLNPSGFEPEPTIVLPSEEIPETGGYTSIGVWLSYNYLPVVLKTKLEMTIRHTPHPRTVHVSI